SPRCPFGPPSPSCTSAKASPPRVARAGRYTISLLPAIIGFFSPMSSGDDLELHESALDGLPRGPMRAPNGRGGDTHLSRDLLVAKPHRVGLDDSPLALRQTGEDGQDHGPGALPLRGLIAVALHALVGDPDARGMEGGPDGRVDGKPVAAAQCTLLGGMTNPPFPIRRTCASRGMGQSHFGSMSGMSSMTSSPSASCFRRARASSHAASQ